MTIESALVTLISILIPCLVIVTFAFLGAKDIRKSYRDYVETQLRGLRQLSFPDLDIIVALLNSYGQDKTPVLLTNLILPTKAPNHILKRTETDVYRLICDLSQKKMVVIVTTPKHNGMEVSIRPTALLQKR